MFDRLRSETPPLTLLSQHLLNKRIMYDAINRESQQSSAVELIYTCKEWQSAVKQTVQQMFLS